MLAAVNRQNKNKPGILTPAWKRSSLEGTGQ